MYVNGKKRKFKEGLTIDQLLKELELSRDLIVVEINGQIISKDNYSKRLKDENIIELVSFIGGG